jgi:death-on-curing protein
MSKYLTLIEILAIHQDQIERFGGSAGIRDGGALESALFRCQSGYYVDVIQEAAALWESLAQNHPFVDGNKRTAFACLYTFLALNGYSLKPDADAIFEFISRLYLINKFCFDELEVWLRQNTVSTNEKIE